MLKIFWHTDVGMIRIGSSARRPFPVKGLSGLDVAGGRRMPLREAGREGAAVPGVDSCVETWISDILESACVGDVRQK